MILKFIFRIDYWATLKKTKKEVSMMKNYSKRYYLILSILLFLLIGSSCNRNKPNSSIQIEKIDGLSTTFIRGVDVSSILSLEESGVVFYNYENQVQDIFKTLKQSGINYIRIRIWNNPWDKEKNSYGGGANDLTRAIEIGKRATKQGMKVMVDFHYSDFWADPSKQKCPKDWQGMSTEQKETAIYAYTKKSLLSLQEAGIQIGIVQIGNEINNGLCEETEWKAISSLLKSGIQAVRDVSSEILVAVHFTNPNIENSYEYYANTLEYYGVKYDVFASSYYPYWHGSLENLTKTLSEIAEKYDKMVLVAETAYPFTNEDSDEFANTVNVLNMDYSVQNQATFIRNVIDSVHKVGDKGLGVFYWEPAWIAVPGSNYQERNQLWERYGSGWASSYAKEYDSEDAGIWYGGSSWDNQALFDSQGHPLESLQVFNDVYTGK